VLFGGWRMTGLGTAVAIFAVADATQLRLQAAGTIPREVWIAAAVLVLLATALTRFRRHGGSAAGLTARPTVVQAAGLGLAAALAALAAANPSVTLPVPLWLGMPYLLALVALGTEGKRRHRAPEALAVPYLRSEV
jgi:ABC-type uncharacterized transport system permease subunit